MSLRQEESTFFSFLAHTSDLHYLLPWRYVLHLRKNVIIIKPRQKKIWRGHWSFVAVRSTLFGVQSEYCDISPSDEEKKRERETTYLLNLIGVITSDFCSKKSLPTCDTLSSSSLRPLSLYSKLRFMSYLKLSSWSTPWSYLTSTCPSGKCFSLSFFLSFFLFWPPLCILSTHWVQAGMLLWIACDNEDVSSPDKRTEWSGKCLWLLNSKLDIEVSISAPPFSAHILTGRGRSMNPFDPWKTNWYRFTLIWCSADMYVASTIYVGKHCRSGST